MTFLALDDLREMMEMRPNVRELYLLQWYDGRKGKPGWFGSASFTRWDTGMEHDWYVVALAVREPVERE